MADQNTIRNAYQVKLSLIPNNKKAFKTSNFSGLVIASSQEKAVTIAKDGLTKQVANIIEGVSIKLLSCSKLGCEFILFEQPGNNLKVVKDDE